MAIVSISSSSNSGGRLTAACRRGRRRRRQLMMAASVRHEEHLGRVIDTRNQYYSSTARGALLGA